MYTPAHFRMQHPEDVLDAVERYPFATLVSSVGGSMTVSQLPIWLDRGTSDSGTLHRGTGDSGTSDSGTGDRPAALFGHLARANPHWQQLETADDLVLVFTGPHGYVSPGWYVDPQLVPTWNYVSVTVHGRAHLLTDPAEVRELVVRLSARHEAQFATPWTIDKMPEQKIVALLRAIIAFRIDIVEIEGKAKLGQNRARSDVESVIGALEASSTPSLHHDLAAAMRRSFDRSSST